MHLLARGATAWAPKMARSSLSRIAAVSEVAYLHGDVSVRSYLANMKEVLLHMCNNIRTCLLTPKTNPREASGSPGEVRQDLDPRNDVAFGRLGCKDICLQPRLAARVNDPE